MLRWPCGFVIPWQDQKQYHWSRTRGEKLFRKDFWDHHVISNGAPTEYENYLREISIHYIPKYYRVSQNRSNPWILWWFITETSTMVVIWNTSSKKNSSLEQESSNQCVFNCYYISFQDMQSFFYFLVSVINHYCIYRLHVFWDSFEWFCLQISSDAK